MTPSSRPTANQVQSPAKTSGTETDPDRSLPSPSRLGWRLMAAWLAAVLIGYAAITVLGSSTVQRLLTR